jgi:uncharacterized repeat protein (TIGR03803 family)
MKIPLLFVLVLIFGGVVGQILPVQSQLITGDIVVSDASSGTGNLGALFRVDPSTGVRTLLSDFGNVAQGPTGVNPRGVVIESSGNVLVIDSGGGTGDKGSLFRVNPSTGTRTLLSDFGDVAQGPTGADPFGVNVEPSGNIIVTDSAAGTGGLGALFRVNPSSGKRTLLSDFGDVGQGPTGFTPYSVVIDSQGSILVIDSAAGTGGLGALFRVNPSTGVRTLLSDFGNVAQGPTGSGPVGIVIESSGGLLVIDALAGTGGLGALFRVNPSTGVRTLLSDFGNVAQGPTGYDPYGVAIAFLPSPVGGVVVPTNKLELLTPYLALAGLIVAVSAVIVAKKRRD